MPKTKKKTRLTERMQGHEPIYPLQQILARRAMQMLLDNEKPTTKHKRSPLVILPPQGGKTGVILEIIYLFILDCIARGRTFQVIAFCGLPDLELTEQTRNRITASVDGVKQIGALLHAFASQTKLTRYPARLQKEGVLIAHNSTKLQRLDLNVPVDVRLFIGDEAHLGNVKGGNIDTMLRNHGVRICEQIHTWDRKTTNHYVAVSATPSAHLLKSK